MARLRVLFENGDPEQTIECDLAKAPFHHDGEPGSILDILLGHGIVLEHACGGNCACTTCHVIVTEGMQQLSENEEEEDDDTDEDLEGLRAKLGGDDPRSVAGGDTEDDPLVDEEALTLPIGDYGGWEYMTGGKH